MTYSSETPLSYAVVGGGYTSAVGDTHMIASQMDRRWKPVAGTFSSRHDVNVESAKRVGVADDRVYDNWQEMLQKEKGAVDALIVLTPTPYHTEIVCTALKLGIPVICEKALTSFVSEAKEIQRVQQETNGFLAMTYNYSGYPAVREIREIIASGELGKIQQVRLDMPQEGFSRLDKDGNKIVPQQWRLEDKEIPTVYLDLGVHLHHLMYFLTGRNPLSVVSDKRNYSKHSDLIDDVMCMARYEDDIRATMWVSKAALGFRNGLSFHIFGEKGSARWHQMYPEDINLAFEDGRLVSLDRGTVMKVGNDARYNRFKAGHPAGFIEAFANLYSDIADSLIAYKAGNPVDSDFVFGADHAIQGLELFAAAEESAKTGTWQDID